MTDDIRPYDEERDRAAVTRIWREVGWIDDDDDGDEAALKAFLDATNVEVALVEGAAECAVSWSPGTIRYQRTDLPLCVVGAVTTSLIGRKHGFATTLTARAVAAGRRSGAAVAALGMFEQGFYDRIGFGSGPYAHEVSFDPRTLRLDEIPYRQPVRLTPDDGPELHRLMARRHRGHGGVVVEPAEGLTAELHWLENPFGLGYRNDEGRLTHALFGGVTEVEHGPHQVTVIGYEEPHQLLELLRLLKELGDQITTVKLLEPGAVQLQDLLSAPMARWRQTRRSSHENGIRSFAWMQFRILDLARCVEARRSPGPDLTLNLTIHDPATELLEGTGGWDGCGGDYRLTIGETSSITEGHDPSSPTLAASINAFSRCWFGVGSATSLALTDDLDGPPSLLAALDEALAGPRPDPGWDF